MWTSNKIGSDQVDLGCLGLFKAPKIEKTHQDSDLQHAEKQVMEEVIARIERGRYLMTSHYDDQRAGILVESIQWLTLDPLLIGISVRKGHEIDPLIRDSRSFAVGFIEEDDKFITRRFSERLNGSDSAIYVEGSCTFDTLLSDSLVTGSPLLPQCKTWIDCTVLRRVDIENAFEFFVGTVVGMVHNGVRVHIESEVPDNED
ncbi:MAG: flavin reductase [Phycisphaerales bacterium]